MRKFMILGAVVALVVAALALPALAQQNGPRFEDRQDYYEDLWNGFEDRYEDSEGWDAFEDRYEDGFEEQGFFVFGDDRFFDFDEDGFFFDRDRFDDNDFDDNDNVDNDNVDNDAGVSQSNEQDVESGDATQSISVTGGGDNSNQCAGVQGVVNTGNATNNTGILQYANEDAEVEVEDSGNFTISPSQTTSCDQQVNQAATAFGR